MSKPGGPRNQKQENFSLSQNQLHRPLILNRGSDRTQLGSSSRLLAKKRLNYLRHRSSHHHASSSTPDAKVRTSNRDKKKKKKYVAELKSAHLHLPLNNLRQQTASIIKPLHLNNNRTQSSTSSIPIPNIGRHYCGQEKVYLHAHNHTHAQAHANSHTSDIAQKVNKLKRILQEGEQDQPQIQIDPRSEKLLQDSQAVKIDFHRKSKRDLHLNMNLNMLVPTGQKYQMDYASIAKQYKAMEQYRSDSPMHQIPCVICKTISSKKNRKIKGKEASKAKSKRNILSKVLFPCEHLCICDTCYTHQFQWRECPLCHQEIKVVFPFRGGRERDDYFDWVNETKPPLPSGFAQAFAVGSKQIIADCLKRSIEDLDGDHDYGGLLAVDKKGGMLSTDDELQSQACILS